ncbi:signal peptidase II [Allorhizobium sp. BGMRC 0089]|uniref:signal peptidase II n=1 Tax=Allorhizobium sonneratiae TaxID=2934936 RepID=UPI0020337E54|nr:signal peptidase II [Allorhizobium sonneratiae]MCM2291570.1 signal peptidase II [Allorhizobium sonneratiae]
MSAGLRFSRLLPMLFILALILADQAIKYAVETRLPVQEVVPVLPMLALYRTHNLGVAFSMLSHLDAWTIIAMRLVIVVFVSWLWSRTDPAHRLARIGYAMIIAGAFGNIIDRFVYGYVVDYILFHTQNWSFAVFNLADSLITVGAGFILLEELVLWLRSRKQAG